MVQRAKCWFEDSVELFALCYDESVVNGMLGNLFYRIPPPLQYEERLATLDKMTQQCALV